MDYAAAPIQPIVQGLLTVSGAAVPPPLGPHIPTFQGKGVSSVTRTVAGADIIYTLFLDEGLPGNAGELQPGPTVLGPQPDARPINNTRGSLATAVHGGTSIVATGVTYLAPVAQPSTDGAFTAILLVFTDDTPAAVDPTDDVASGIEIIVWKGL